MKHVLQPLQLFYLIKYFVFLIKKRIQASIREMFPNILRIEIKCLVQ